MARPHEKIAQRRNFNAEYEARRVELEAKYGLPYEKLPDVLRHPAPKHPQHSNARRFDDVSMLRVWRTRTLLLASRTRFGWRTQRRYYLRQLEAIRQAEIAVRKLRAKRTGRGKPLDRKAHIHARERIEAREWRHEL